MYEYELPNEFGSWTIDFNKMENWPTRLTNSVVYKVHYIDGMWFYRDKVYDEQGKYCWVPFGSKEAKIIEDLYASWLVEKELLNE